jgi:hypothetical protein
VCCTPGIAGAVQSMRMGWARQGESRCRRHFGTNYPEDLDANGGKILKCIAMEGLICLKVEKWLSVVHTSGPSVFMKCGEFD